MNYINIMGNLTKDPNLSYTNDGKAFCKFTVAVNHPWKKDHTDFFSCIAFNKTAEIIGEHFAKGRQIIVAGSIHQRVYDPGDGTKRHLWELIVERFHFTRGSGANHVDDHKHDQRESDDDGYTSIDDLPF